MAGDVMRGVGHAGGGNIAVSGGGSVRMMVVNFGATLKLDDITIEDGSSDNDGGGIFDQGRLSVGDSTFSGNSAGNFGGGISNDGSASLKGTILAGNPSGTGESGGNCSSPPTDLGYNISDDGSCGFSQSGSSNNYTGPLLSGAGLANNGGPTETIALAPGTSGNPNQAIDAIPKAQCPSTDQRGYARPDNGESFCGIGAYESGATAPLSFGATKLELAPSTGGFDLKSSFTPTPGSAIEPLTLTIGDLGGSTSVTAQFN